MQPKCMFLSSVINAHDSAVGIPSRFSAEMTFVEEKNVSDGSFCVSDAATAAVDGDERRHRGKKQL